MASAASSSFELPTPKHVILVVEDDVLMRSGIAEHLRDSGFVVIEAANAAEAMTILSSRSEVDFVFSDVAMPGPMDGFALAQWVHRHHEHIPVLLTSGASAVVNSPDAYSREPFMRKPFLPQELEQRIRTMLRI